MRRFFKPHKNDIRPFAELTDVSNFVFLLMELTDQNSSRDCWHEIKVLLHSVNQVLGREGSVIKSMAFMDPSSS